MKRFLNALNKKSVFLPFIAVLLVVIGALIVFSQKPVQGNWLVIITSLINIVLFLIKLVMAIKARPFSFDMMVWLFNLFFFGYVPLLQHLTNRYAWNLVPSFGEVTNANLLVLLWSVFYILSRKYQLVCLNDLTKKLRTNLENVKSRVFEWLNERLMDPLKEKLNARQKKWASVSLKKYPSGTLQDSMHRCWVGYQQLDAKRKLMDVLLLTAIALTATDLILVGFTAQFSRSTSGISGGSTAMSLLLNHGLNNMILFVATLHVFAAREQKKVDVRTVVALLCLLLACFPTGLSRNMMASFYAGLLVVMFKQTKKGRWFSLVILVGIVLIFPAIEVFRRASTLQNGNLFELLLDSIRSSYLGGHFDAHQNIITIMRYVDEFGITWGRQLLGAVLFFVPRAIWPNKPIGTGHTAIIALAQNDFTNVSAPVVAEGFVNFGIVGVILFAWIIGKITRKLDKAYWKKRKGWGLIDMLYPHAMFMFFFLLRGDMMSSWAYTFAQCVVGTVVYSVYKFGKTLTSTECK